MPEYTYKRETIETPVKGFDLGRWRRVWFTRSLNPFQWKRSYEMVKGLETELRKEMSRRMFFDA